MFTTQSEVWGFLKVTVDAVVVEVVVAPVLFTSSGLQQWLSHGKFSVGIAVGIADQQPFH